MKKLMAGLMIAAVAALAGCNTSTSTPTSSTGSGSPRTSSYPPADTGRPAPADTARPPTDTTREKAPAVGSKEPFKLTGPGALGGLTSDVTLKQGEKKEIKVGVHPSQDYKGGVQLQVKNAPKGLTVTPAKPDVPAGDDHVMVTVEATKDAPLGKQTVDLVGTPEGGKGGEQTLQLKVNVEKSGEK
jgi:hypothetical protein